MNIRHEKTVDIDGVQIRIREPTLAEIRSALQESHPLRELEEPDDTDTVWFFLLRDTGVSIADILLMTDANRESLASMTPSQLRRLVAACKEVNPDFFALLNATAATVQTIREAAALGAKDSSGTLNPPVAP